MWRFDDERGRGQARGRRAGPISGSGACAVAGLVLVAAACVDSTGLRWVDTLDAVPDSAHLVPGGSAAFEVRVFDQQGDEMPEWVDRVRWSVSDATLADLDTVEAGASVTALAPGTVLLRAALGRGDRAIPIFVRPAELDHVTIEPDPILVSRAGGSVRAAAHLFNADGQELSPEGYRISWASFDTTRVVVSTTFNPPWETNVRAFGQSTGQTRIKVIVNDLVGFADVTVTDLPIAPASVEVTPLSSTSLRITWSGASGATRGYRLYRSESTGSGYVHIASPGLGYGIPQNETTWVDLFLQPGTTYFYVVEACNPFGCTDRSPEGSGTTLPESARDVPPVDSDEGPPAGPPGGWR